MINRDTGDIHFPDWDESLSPDMTRSSFLASPLATGANISVKNEPWCSWNIPPTEWDGKQWYTTVYFNNEELRMIHIGASSPEFGTSWDDWSKDKQMSLKRFHDEVLNRELGPLPYDFTWGSVTSVFDDKAGDSCIVIGLSNT